MPTTININRNAPAAADAPDAVQVSRINGWLEDLFGLPDITDFTAPIYTQGLLLIAQRNLALL